MQFLSTDISKLDGNFIMTLSSMVLVIMADEPAARQNTPPVPFKTKQLSLVKVLSNQLFFLNQTFDTSRLDNKSLIFT